MDKLFKRNKRKKHIRKYISGTEVKPRLTVFRSNKHIYAQLIDDVSSKTLASASDFGLNGTPKVKAKEVGKLLAEKSKSMKLSSVVFDRNGYKYHGRVKELADSARENGLNF